MLKKSLVFLIALTCLAKCAWSMSSSDALREVTEHIHNKCFISALNVIDCYRCEHGEDCIFDTMLGLIAENLDEETLCYLLQENSAAHWSELFYQLAQKRTKDSIALQKQSELLARKLLTQEPCNPDHYTRFAQTAKIFENVPRVDYVAVQNAYENILCLDWNCQSLADMANAAHLSSWLDYSSLLYRQYFATCCGSADQYYDYSIVLENQYNITLALRMNEFYGQCVNYNTNYWKNLANILNYGNLAEGSYPILVSLLEEEPDDFLNWAIFAQSAATINHRYESIYGLRQAECRKPADIETEWAQWMALPPIMSKATIYGSSYHESTTLTNIVEGATYFAAKDLYTRYIVGFEAFHTSARPKILLIGGLGRLTGPQGQEHAEVETGWLGVEKLIHPKLLATVNVGAGRAYVAGPDESWTPAYNLYLESRYSDYLNLRLFSSYNFYQISPRTSTFNLCRWRNELTIDFRPDYDTQFLSIFDGRAVTDGNKQLEIFFFPRRTFFYLEHWKMTAGLLGNWLTTRKDPLHGYYAPQLYQVYAAQIITEYRVNRHSSIRGYAAGGTQKDNFSTFFGPYTQLTLDCLFGLSLNWQLRLFGDYYFVKQSTGSFNYMKFLGELTYRF